MPQEGKWAIEKNIPMQLRSLFRIHLSTAVILMFVASLIVFLNIPSTMECNKPDPTANIKGCLITYEVHSQGWPFQYSYSIYTGKVWYVDDWGGDTDISFWDFCYRKNSGIRWSFIIDVCTWLAILGLTAACSELWFTRQTPKKL